MRENVAAKRKQSAMAEAPKAVNWVPRPKSAAQKVAAPSKVPSLQDICIDFLAHNITACIDNGLGGIVPELQATLCEKVCALRKLHPEVLPIFTEEGTSVLSLPDCSYIGEQEMTEAVQRVKGPQLRNCTLRYCGRSMSDKLIELLCEECPNIQTLTLLGCYRVTDKGIAGVCQVFCIRTCWLSHTHTHTHTHDQKKYIPKDWNHVCIHKSVCS
jgi:hypothetical protein